MSYYQANWDWYRPKFLAGEFDKLGETEPQPACTYVINCLGLFLSDDGKKQLESLSVSS